MLARVLAPEAFGVIATVTMITSFADMLSDAGFQRYLIQHSFDDEDDLDRNANVAFWSSMTVTLLLLGLIAVFRDPLASLVGNPGLGFALLLASCALPLNVCIGTQLALFRRSFAYKKLMPIRVGVSLIPLLVTIPLAMAGFDYWSLIIGTLSGCLVNAVALTVVSPWRPRAYYSISLFRKMFAFSGWSLLEAFSIWMTLWAGTFIVSNLLTPYYLGLYKQPMALVNSMFALITSATTPILFAALSRLQTDRKNFKSFFLTFQFSAGMLVLPIGFGAFLFRDFFINLLMGGQWHEASLMFGAWSLSSSLMIVFSHYCSEVYRSLGKPLISFVSQCIYMAFMIPAIYLAARHSFEALVVTNAAIRLVAILINQIIMFLFVRVGFLTVLRNLRTPLLAVAAMSLCGAWLAPATDGSVVLSLLGILACAVVYCLVCLCFSDARALFLQVTAKARSRGRGRGKAEAASEERGEPASTATLPAPVSGQDN